MAKYFITGATGTVGKEVVQNLLKAGAQVVAATRHPEKSKTLFGAGAEHLKFDFADPDTFGEVKGTDGVFVLGPPLDPNLFALLEPFVDYLAAHGPKRVVYLSANGMEEMKELPFHDQMEQKLQASSLDWRILRPGFFMQNFGNYERENIEERGILFSPAGSGKTAFISAGDIGAAAAEVLTNDQYGHQIFTLTGDQLFSYFEVAERLSNLLGKKITYANPDEATYRRVLQESGAPPFIADYMIPVYGLIKADKVSNRSDDVAKLLGRRPELLERVLERDFA